MFMLKSRYDRLAEKEEALKLKIATVEKEEKEDILEVNANAKSAIEEIKLEAAKKVKSLKSKLDLITRLKQAEHDHVVSTSDIK